MSVDEVIRSFEVSENELDNYFQDLDRINYNHLERLIASGDKAGTLRFINQVGISERTCRNLGDDCPSPLAVAARNGKFEIAKGLLDSGLDFLHPRETPPLHCAAFNGHLSVVQLLAGYGFGLDDPDIKGNSPLFHAVDGKQKVVVRFLLELGCDINRVNNNGDTILHRLLRISGCSLDILENIFSKGFSKLNFQDPQGRTALAWSLIRRQELQVITFLLHKGADIWLSIKNKTMMPFEIAVLFTDDIIILRALYNAGANPERLQNNRLQISSLVLAVLRRKLNYVRFLVKELGVDMDGISRRDHSDALMLAMKMGSLDIALFLLRAGCSVTRFHHIWCEHAKHYSALWDKWDPDVKVKIETLMTSIVNPRSLQDICTGFVRRRLGRAVLHKSQELQIPSLLVNYVRLDHL